MWEIKIQHEGLNKYRVIRGHDKKVVEQKASVQSTAWEEMWQRKLEKQVRQSKLEEAKEHSKKATEDINTIENILKDSLKIDHKVDWESSKDNSQFSKPKPIPIPPLKLGVLDSIFSSKKQEKIKRNAELKQQYKRDLEQWEAEKHQFLNKQRENNDFINTRKEQYLHKAPDAIIDYCKIVLSDSEYPDYFPKEFSLDYNPETKILIVEYSLLSIDNIPKLKEARYVKTRDEVVEIFLSESFLNKLYDNLIYQITLRTIHELYQADDVSAIDSIVFNGWVESINKATGQEINACILSVQANRQEFLSINLENVDPKECFKNLKGIGSSKLHSLTPIAPILNISREDKRFISSYGVAGDIEEQTNIAAMDWQDFEHLIRELFEKEFSQYGGEVKITQSSRDKGVDAVAFDPDPIRGGKIIIQAKRYTNTVEVSAVRDLYGTVMNEGATKGILVTTADYGPDAYDFAKGKPLTLLNGSNLLHLLEKHGHKAKIDLKAAKQTLSERNKNNN